MEALKKRQRALNREANVSAIEAASIGLKVGETKTFKVMDVQAWQRVRTRLSRLKSKTNLKFETDIDGNNLTVKRIS